MALEPLIDGHGRRIADLRVSVTDRCNFRCQYCMPAEGLPWLERDDVLRFEEIERLVALLAADGHRRRAPDRRRAAGAPRLPALAAMLAAIDGVDDLCVTTNGYLLERDAAALVDAGIDRFNVSIDSLQRDRFFEMTRRDALPQVLRGLEALAAFPEAHPIKVNAVAMRGFTEARGAAVRRASRASTPTRCASSSSCRSTPTAPGRRDQVLTGEEIRAAIDAELPARARAARAARDRARLPLRRRPRADRLHQPGLRAVLRRLQPHPPDRRRQAAHLPVLAATRPTCAGRCARARATPSSSRSSATRSGARSSSTTSTSRASSSRRGR